jgi:hypothetical protein
MFFMVNPTYKNHFAVLKTHVHIYICMQHPIPIGYVGNSENDDDNLLGLRGTLFPDSKVLQNS